MISTILGIKKGMTVGFDHRGHRIPVTQIVAEPNVVVSTKDTVVQLGFGQKKKAKKTENGFVNSVGFAPKIIKQIKVQNAQNIKVGDKVTVAAFALKDQVKVTGTTKGRGFAGGIKRWGFHGGPKTHGQSDRHRAPGSIGQGTTPGRVFKGKKMAGHYGAEKQTTTGLEVVGIDTENNMLLVKGAVPGANKGFLIIEKTGKVKSYTPPPEEKPKDDEEAEGAKEDKKEEVKEEKENKDAKS